MIPTKAELKETKENIKKHYPHLKTALHCIEIVENLPSEEEIKDIGADLIEKHFPKGKCKERGAALVLYAELVIRIIERLRHNKH